MNAQAFGCYFIPNLQEGELYKFEIHTPSNNKILKSDPYAFYSEVRPKTASVIKRLDSYTWNDSKWMKDRTKTDLYHRPMSIYEVHAGTWKQKVTKRLMVMKTIKETIIRFES